MTEYLIELGLFFICASVLASFEIEKFKYKRALFLFSFALLIISLYYSNFRQFQFITLPLLVVLFGQASTKYISNISTKMGDLSYGIYIYGYPVQQTLVHYFKFNYLELMISSLLVTYILGYASWHLVEKRALRLNGLDFGLKGWNISNDAVNVPTAAVYQKQEAAVHQKPEIE